MTMTHDHDAPSRHRSSNTSPACRFRNGKTVPVAVPLDGDHVLRRADRHVHRAAVRGDRLARAARRAPERADRRVQHVRADLLQRDDRAGAWKRPSAIRPAKAKGWILLTFLLGSVFLGVKAYEYQQKFAHGIYPAAAARPGLRQGRRPLRGGGAQAAAANCETEITSRARRGRRR